MRVDIKEISAIIILILQVACKQSTLENSVDPAELTLFKELTAERTQVDFENTLVENSRINILNYLYYYNGCGVALGDINNDGLPDIYLASTTGDNKLYLNRGDLQFEDITDRAGVGGGFGITTGVSMVDINNDGYLDIYVCKSGMQSPAYRTNLLFINNGKMQFKEQAAAYGLDDHSFSNQAYFFDMDGDQDLDMFLVNHPIDWPNINKIMTGEQEMDGFDYQFSDKLFRNEEGKFKDITKESGLLNRSWGLSAAIGDFNGDQLPDIYVANDFIKPDNLYINQGNGTFNDQLKDHFRHISFYSMGCDYADFNNDGHNDLYVVDMAMKGHERSKRNMGSMSTEDFRTIVRRGYHYPYSINTLHLNLGNDRFTEIAQVSGVDKTDWSWSPLMLDLDNDGLKDIFVSNGVYRDIIDNDFLIKKAAYDSTVSQKDYYQDLLGDIPTSKIKNIVFKNRGDLTFQDMSEQWGIISSTNANGAAYADLDRDGDLDLVTNNLNEPASIYENSASLLANNYLQISLKGSSANRGAIGARLEIYHQGIQQRLDLYPNRGYLSSSDYVLHFGLGDEEVDSLVVTWPDGRMFTQQSPGKNKRLELSYQDSQEPISPDLSSSKPLITDISGQIEPELSHSERFYDDFKREILLPHQLSELGPFLSVGDIDQDGLEDFFVGGAAGSPGSVYMQTSKGTFESCQMEPWQQDSEYEDLGSALFDADGDGDLDLYVVSGSNEHQDSKWYQDRLYLNEGGGHFTRSAHGLPDLISSGQAVDYGDFDQDGDLDLVVAGRQVPGEYPMPASSYLLENHEGKFTDITEATIPGFSDLGMVTDVTFCDYDGDKDLDILVVGEWMAPVVFRNHNGVYESIQIPGLEDLEGWWFNIAIGDLDNDGDEDYILGNLGENNKYKPTPDHPLQLMYGDFDNNGSGDIVLTKTEGASIFPIRGRECSSQQMPFIAEKFPDFQSFAAATVEEIFSHESMAQALSYQVKEFTSMVLLNQGTEGFKSIPLPKRAQFSPLMAMELQDLNGDGYLDVLAAGNMWETETETMRYDAGSGLCLLGNGNGEFSPLNIKESGLYVSGNVRDLALIEMADGNRGMLVTQNDELVQLLKITNKLNL